MNEESKTVTTTFGSNAVSNKCEKLHELLQYFKLFTEDYRNNFIQFGTMIEDSNSRELLANQVATTILHNLSYDLKLSWKEEHIHKKLCVLENELKNYNLSNNIILWRPKSGDINHQINNRAVILKLEYKTFLENELAKRIKYAQNLESKVTELCLKVIDIQKHIQNKDKELVEQEKKIKEKLEKI